MNQWPTLALGDLCRIEIGGTPSRGDARYWDPDKVTRNIWLSIADLPQVPNARVGSSKEHLSDAGAARVKIVPSGTLLVSFKLTLGRLAFAACDLRTNEAIAALYIKNEEQLLREYLYWYLRYFDWQTAANGDEKVKGKTLNKAKLKALPVFIPPIAEQRRIVAILDEAFEGIATATANAEKNLANARLIPSAGLAEMSFGVDKAVQSARLADLVTRLTNGFVGPIAKVYVEKGIPYLLARHVKDDRLNFDGRTHITDEFNARCAKSILRAGDVLLVQSGHIGHSAVVPPEHEGHNCHAMIVISPTEKLRGTYLSAYFNSRMGRLATQKIRSGSTVPHLTCKAVRELMIPVPSIRQQDALIERHAALKAESAKLVDAQLRKLALLAELKQSLLHRAFNGDLTPAEALAA